MRFEVVIHLKDKNPVKIQTDDFESPREIYDLFESTKSGLVMLKSTRGGILLRKGDVISMEVNEFDKKNSGTGEAKKDEPKKVVEAEIVEDDQTITQEDEEYLKGNKVMSTDLTIPTQFRSFRDEFVRTAYSGQTLQESIVQKMKKRKALLKRANQVVDQQLVDLESFINEQVGEED